MPRVTFVLPTFNGQAYVSQAIDSIIAQRETDWQALIVDDSSVDNTPEIVSKYRSANISYIRNESNIGLYATLHRFVRGINSEYVSILHQDDRLHSDYLKVLLRVVEAQPDVNAFWVGQDTIDGRGKYLARGRHAHRVDRIEPSTRAWMCGLRQGCFFTISGSLTRPSFFQAFPFRTDLPHCGDYDWLLRVLRCAPMTYVGQPLIDIRQHRGQASARNLASGRDVHDEYLILSDNLRRYRRDVSIGDALATCTGRARLVGRRAAGAIARGRWAAAARLNGYVVRYLWLAGEMAAYKRQ